MSESLPLSIPDLLSDESKRCAEFPVVRDSIFLGHAAVCPLPTKVLNACTHYLEQAALNDQESVFSGVQVHSIRRGAAEIIQCSLEEVALIGPTSNALSMIAEGLPYGKGDEILVYFDDYPSNVYPWVALEEKGVTIRYIQTRSLGEIGIRELEQSINKQTRLVALASCHYLSGYRIDIDRIGEYLHTLGIKFCLDAIQTVGAFPTTMQHVDFMAADSHKWMLGPCGAGILFVKKDLQDFLKPRVYGWHNLTCPDFLTQEAPTFRKDARRYEAGTPNLLGLAGLSAALKMIQEVGVQAITDELLRKRKWFVPKLLTKGFKVLHSETTENQIGGMISIFSDSRDMRALHTALLKQKIVSSIRSDSSGRSYLRFSPHYYNTDEELSRILNCL